MKKIVSLALAIAFGGFLMFAGIKYFGFGIEQTTIHTNDQSTPVQFTGYAEDSSTEGAPVDFRKAARNTLPAVVHIRSSVRYQGGEADRELDLRMIPDPFRDFFSVPRENQRRGQAPMRQGSGSGVIISDDGYIVTNNHVIDNASELEVTLNDKRTYTATVIGVDPSTDIALIKIDEEDLEFIGFANSDDVEVGEWAVAVGNPFNLSSTVTAGIVSAKGRSINIMRGRTPIESFIQTDAAVNPGNSGGALVNLDGHLIGINTAIASPTGSYSGYSFAVPSNIVNKVVADLKEYGVVQRGFIGALIRNVDNDLAEEAGLSTAEGVYVDSLTANSAAADAGIKSGDVIVAVDGYPVKSSPQLLEYIGRHRPGDEVPITVMRNGNERSILVTLRNREGTTDIIRKEDVVSAELVSSLGATFKDLSADDISGLDIDGGVQVVELGRGKLSQETNMEKGFIITKINRTPVKSVKDLEKILSQEQGGVMLEGVYPDSAQKYYYAFGL